jgi:hypothetical protein
MQSVTVYSPYQDMFIIVYVTFMNDWFTLVTF